MNKIETESQGEQYFSRQTKVRHETELCKIEFQMVSGISWPGPGGRNRTRVVTSRKKVRIHIFSDYFRFLPTLVGPRHPWTVEDWYPDRERDLPRSPHAAKLALVGLVFLR